MGAGRPEIEIKKEYYKQAEKLALLGMTNDEMAAFFEISPRTFDNWLAKDEKFMRAVRSGKVIADAKVAQSLYKRANGYSHPDVDIRVADGRIVQTKITKHYPPDTTAGIFFLKNRQPKKWREKQEIENTNMNVDVTVTAEEAQAIKNKLLGKI